MSKGGFRWLFGAIVVLVLITLFSFPRFKDASRELVRAWKDFGVGCLPSHQNAALHIHPELTITIDGIPETVPGNIGIVQSCMAEVHTHDASGKIHIESISAGKTFTFNQFLAVWGKQIEREGYDLAITVQGGANAADGDFVMQDHQPINLFYTTRAVGKTPIPSLSHRP